MGSVLSQVVWFGGGAAQMHCALWRGCGGSTYGLIVLRLCRMSTPPANPPVGGFMPVNYCTFGEEKIKQGKRERNRKIGKEMLRKTKKKKRRSERQDKSVREKPPWL